MFRAASLSPYLRLAPPAVAASLALSPGRPQDSVKCDPATAPSSTPSSTALPFVESDYPYFSAWNNSLLRRHLTPEIYNTLSPLATSNGYTLNDLIQCGCATGYSLPRNMGVMTGDYECYSLFKPLLDPIIAHYHQFKDGSRHITDMDHEKLSNTPDVDKTKQYVLSSRIRVSRSIENIPFPAAASRSEMRKVERLVMNATSGLSDELKGMYVQLNDMTNEENDDLIQRHILFDNPDEWATQAGLGRNWPDARGLYVNVEDIDANPSFICWINEEDHLRIMVMLKGGDIARVFKLLATGVEEIEKGLKEEGNHFLHDDRLGFVTGCPTNLGTGMRASMHVKLMKIGRQKGFKAMCKRMGLEVRGKHGEKDHRNSGIYDISNRHRLGFSEIQLVQLMIDGVGKLIELEMKLEKGEEVDCDKLFQAV
jgi:creatine kinase